MKPIMAGTGILLVCWFVAASAQQRTEIKEEPAHKVFGTEWLFGIQRRPGHLQADAGFRGWAKSGASVNSIGRLGELAVSGCL